MSTQKTIPSKEEIQPKPVKSQEQVAQEARKQAAMERMLANQKKSAALELKIQEAAKREQEAGKRAEEAGKRADAHGRAAAANIALAYQIQERDQQQRLDTLKKGNQSWQGYNNTREQQQGSASIIAGK